MEENYTARFKADISDLQKNITTANRKMKEINSEYKNAASAAELSGDAQAALAAKMKQVEDTMGALKSKIEAYRAQISKTEDYIEALRKEESQLQEEMERTKKEYGENSDEAQEYAKKLEAVQKSIEGAENNLTSLKTKLNNTEAELNQNAKAMKDLQEGANNAKAGVKNMADSLTAVNTATAGLSATVDGLTNKLINLAATGIRTAINGLKELVTTSFTVGSGFEKSMSTAQATMMATAEEMEPLKELAAELGESTVKSATDVADSYNYMAMAGWKAEEMMSGISAMLNLSIASGEDMATVTDIVTDALTAFGMTAADASEFCDVMAATASNANTNVGLMGESFKYVASLAGAMGYSVQDVGIALGLMANSGVKASQAGTSLRSAITRLAAPTDQVTEALKQLGLVTTETITSYDTTKIQQQTIALNQQILKAEQLQREYNEALQEYGSDSEEATEAQLKYEAAAAKVTSVQEKLAKVQAGSTEEFVKSVDLLEDQEGNMRSLAEVIDILRTKFAGLTETEKAEIASVIAGKNAMSGFLAIVNSADADVDKLTEAIYGANGACAEMAAIAGDNLDGSLKGLESRLEAVQLAIYDKLERPVRSAVDTVAGKFGELATALSTGDMAPGMERIGASLDRFAEKLGPIIDQNMPAMVSLFDSFATSVTKVIDAMPGLVEESLPKLLDLATNMMEGMPTFIDETLPSMIDGIIWLTENGDSLIKTLLGIKVGLTGLQAGSSIASIVNMGAQLFGSGGVFAGAGAAISGAFSSIGTVISGVGSAVLGAVGWPGLIVGAFVGGFTLLYTKCEGFRDFVNGIGEEIGDFFSGVGEKVKGFFADFSMDDVKNAFKDAKEAAGDFFSDVGDWVSGKYNEAMEGIKTKTSGVKDWFAEKFGAAKESVHSIAEAAKDITMEDIAYEAGRIAGSVVTDLSTAKDTVQAFFAGLPTDVQVKLDEIVTNATEWGGNLITAVGTGASEAITAADTAISEFPGKAKAWFDETLTNAKAWGQDTVDAVSTKAKEMVDDASTYLSELPGKAKAKFDEAKENISQSLTEWKDNAGRKIKEVTRAIKDGVKDLPGEMLNAGKDTVQGFINGIGEKISGAVEKAKSLARSFLKGYKDELEIASPSKAMKRLSAFIPEGAAEGVKEKTGIAVRAIKTMAQNMTAGFDVAGFSAKLQNLKVGISASAGTYANRVGQAQTIQQQKNETTNNNNKSVTYAPTFNYNKPLNARETYRQNKNALNAILGVT